MKEETIKELQATYYGKVELIPGIKCDGYVLSDGTACLSERGTADLLGMKQAPFQRMTPKWPPKTLKPFIGAVQSMTPKSIKVVAKNSPYQGRNIVTYDSKFIGSFIRGYALALAHHNKLRPNQIHIGERCVILSTSLIDTTIYTAIQQACGLNPNIQKIAQTNYTQVGQAMKDSGLTSSIGNNIYTKKDITNYITVPLSTLNSNIHKLHDDISVINLDRAIIKASGSKAPRMNGYNLEDVGKIVLGMDSVIGIELKKQVFGTVGTLAKLDTKGEIEWQHVLAQVFENLGFNHNYQMGKYKIDFFIKDLNLVLECNGYDNHIYYNDIEEQEREQFIIKNYSLVRFHHLTDWKTLVNGILRTKIGDTTVLYNVGKINSSQIPVKSNIASS
ncbi:MAG: DUF559 domain-containing protein [Candidatus Marithrix sp.]